LVMMVVPSIQFSVVAADDPLDTVQVSTYVDASCSTLIMSESFPVVEPGYRCGESCIPDGSSSANVICAQSSTVTLFSADLWINSSSCAFNPNVTIIANATNTNVSANTFCMLGSLSADGFTLPIYLIVDCGSNSPDPNSGIDHLSCEYSTKQKALLIGTAVGGVVLIGAIIAACVYCYRRRRAASANANMNAQYQTQVLINPHSQTFTPQIPNPIVYHPQYNYPYQQPTTTNQYVRF